MNMKALWVGVKLGLAAGIIFQAVDRSIAWLEGRLSTNIFRGLGRS
jgi:predicted small secreted protein